MQFIEGRGRLLDAHTVAIGDRVLTARHILIATGARAFVPKFDGHELCIVSDNVLELDKVSVSAGSGQGPTSWVAIVCALDRHDLF